MLRNSCSFQKIFLGVLMVISSVVHTSASAHEAPQSSPDQILKEFDLKGARKFFEDHQLVDEVYWNNLKKGIEGGGESWLNVASKLRTASDGGVSETLDVSLGNAIKKNPLGVLKIIDQINHSVCKALKFDDSDAHNVKNDLRELNTRLISLNHLKGSALAENLKGIKKQCEDEIKDLVSDLKTAK